MIKPVTAITAFLPIVLPHSDARAACAVLPACDAPAACDAFAAGRGGVVVSAVTAMTLGRDRPEGKVLFPLQSIDCAYDGAMQMHQLTYFVAVAEARHFTRAADELGVAQPSLSQQIRALERDVGSSLLNRVRGNLSLTDAGEILLPIARRILADAEAAKLEIRELGDLRRGRVRLGATPSLCTGLLPPILAMFRSAHPGIQLVVHESGSRDLQRSLTEGALDLALIIDPRLPGDDQQLLSVPLLDEELVVISPRDAPAPTRTKRMDIRALEGLPLVMFREGYDLREATIAACRAAGFEPTYAVDGGEMDAVLEFVHAGLGLAIVPSTVVGDRFRATPFASPGLRRTVRLARRQDVQLPRATAALRDSILRFLANASKAGTLPVGVVVTGR
jgi:DNA-binding transcriptional LysR family regulator